MIGSCICPLYQDLNQLPREEKWRECCRDVQRGGGRYRERFISR